MSYEFRTRWKTDKSALKDEAPFNKINNCSRKLILTAVYESFNDSFYWLDYKNWSICIILLSRKYISAGNVWIIWVFFSISFYDFIKCWHYCWSYWNSFLLTYSLKKCVGLWTEHWNLYIRILAQNKHYPLFDTWMVALYFFI